MRRIMAPMLLLAAVTISTGVELPHLPPLKPGLEPVTGQSSSDSHNTPTECDVLRRLFHSQARWMFDTDNNQEEYNDNINKRQVNMYDYHSMDDEWFNYPKQFYQPQGFEKKHLYEPNSYADDEAQDRGYETPPLPTIKTLYFRNKDVVIQDDQTYYVYDTYLATTSPFDYIHDRHNCLYKSILRPSSRNALSVDAKNLELQEERERLGTNEITPVADTVMAKRFEEEELGEKEMPDNLAVSEADTREVQKKLFSFWSRLQALSHKGRQLPTRRHTFVYYGPDGTRDDPLTAETRASHIRPPGQPLRWG